MTRCSTRVVLGIPVLALVVAAVAVAGNVVGTAGADKLRGTAGNDTMKGLAGNDRLVGLAGNDTLVGGPGRDLTDGGAGNDRLVLRDGERDVAVCGAGRDTVLADEFDAIRAGCEIVRTVAVGPAPPPPAPPPPPEPPPPPPPPPAANVDAGSWKGATQNGDYIFFTVTSSRTVKGFRANDFREECNGGLYTYGPLDFGSFEMSIDDAGQFGYEGTSNGTIGGVPATFTTKVTGVAKDSSASGTVTLSSEFVYDGTRYQCSTGLKTWSAQRLP